MNCPNCGKPVSDGAGFCPACGTPLQAAAPQPQQQAGYSQAPMGISAQGGFGQAPMPGMPQPSGNKTLAIASMTCGIVGLLLDFLAVVPFAPVVGLILGIVAIVLFSKAKKAGQGNGMATAGLVCGIIAIVFGIGATLCLICAVGATAGANGAVSDLSRSLSSY